MAAAWARRLKPDDERVEDKRGVETASQLGLLTAAEPPERGGRSCKPSAPNLEADIERLPGKGGEDLADERAQTCVEPLGGEVARRAHDEAALIKMEADGVLEPRIVVGTGYLELQSPEGGFQGGWLGVSRGPSSVRPALPRGTPGRRRERSPLPATALSRLRGLNLQA
jgi:hypothetical protein